MGSVQGVAEALLLSLSVEHILELKGGPFGEEADCSHKPEVRDRTKQILVNTFCVDLFLRLRAGE